MSMFNNLPVRLLFLSTLFYFPSAHASDLYAELDAGITRITTADTEFSPLVSRIKVGYEFSKYAVEVQYAAGASEDEVNSTTVEIDQQAGMYFRVNYGLDRRAKIYLSLGVAQTNFTYTGNLEADKYRDFSYGIGFEDYFPGVKDMRITLEYSEYYKDKDLEILGLSLGVRYNF